MLCRGNSIRTGRSSGSIPVYLNVYDLTSMNLYAYWLGFGAFHSGVQVHEIEYAFGSHENPTSGIFEGEPKQAEGFTFRKQILIGWTEMNLREVRQLMEELSGEYRGTAYNLITKNCNHFCNDVCIRLTGNPIPSWVNRLARIGFVCNCIIPASVSSKKVRHHGNGEEDVVKKKLNGEKVYDGDEIMKRLRSRSSRFSSSPTSSADEKCSSETPPVASRTGRSRSRNTSTSLLSPSSSLILSTSSA